MGTSRARAAALAVGLVLAAPRAARTDLGDSGLGVNTHVPAADLLDMCEDLGVSWIRVDGNWDTLSPAEGTYDWAVMDAVVDGARARGLEVFMTLAYTPAWVPRVARARADTYPGNDEPLTSDEWTQFVEDAVAHYSARGVRHFGLWNEPNLDGFWEEAAGLEAWVDTILVPGAAAVRAACPTCLVLGPELANVGECDVFLDGVLARAIGEIDIITHHIYQGWPETGTRVWDGDNFLQALESRRFPWTRESLREVLDRHGWTGEVWISETGYEADVGDSADEDLQAVYVRRVMEEQLARPWWTNSFFYEITDCGVDQPGCPIDGFGITRPSRAVSEGGPRAFPDDYRLKPAYLEIRGFVEDHPEIVMATPAAACGDGLDNDGDGRVDAADHGCEGGTDDDESDDPPRRRVEALPPPAGGVAVDGDLSEWSAEGWVDLGADDWVGVVPYGGAADLSARLAARWAAGVLWIAVEVADETHVNARPDPELWAADSAQLAFDVARSYGSGYDDTDDHELTFALVAGETRSFRFHGPPAATDAWEAAVARTGATTTYEIRLPAEVLAPATLAEGELLGFSMLVNDNDGEATEDGSGREGWVELTPGIGSAKDPYELGELALVSSPTPPDGDGDVDSDSDSDTDADSDVDSDADGDGGPGPDGGGGGSGDEGCACRAAPPGGAPGWPLLALAALLALRRR